MTRKIFGPRKQRTRQHIIADLSAHHVEGFILEAGHTLQRVDRDYGYDLILFTFDERGYVEPGLVFLQLKATESLSLVGANYVFDVDVRDCNLWRLEEMPVILVLFDASHRRAYWLAIQAYFREDSARLPKKGAKTVRVQVPQKQRVTRRAVEKIRELKNEVVDPPTEEEP
jgi:hypothetical protein